MLEDKIEKRDNGKCSIATLEITSSSTSSNIIVDGDSLKECFETFVKVRKELNDSA